MTVCVDCASTNSGAWRDDGGSLHTCAQKRERERERERERNGLTVAVLVHFVAQWHRGRERNGLTVAVLAHFVAQWDRVGSLVGSVGLAKPVTVKLAHPWRMLVLSIASGCQWAQEVSRSQDSGLLVSVSSVHAELELGFSHAKQSQQRWHSHTHTNIHT